jgi:SAM-dependent methyltransferase
MNLRDAWEAEAANWVAWARRPGHDSYWRFHRDRFLDLLPPPGGLVLDVGCGEGRLPRDLRARGYDVIGIDPSPTLIRHAREADPDGDYREADGADLPLPDASVAIVTAFMTLHDIDDMDGAVREIARVLAPGGRACVALVHPINSAGRFEDRTPDAPFVIRDSYLAQRHYADRVERDGLVMTFTSVHRPLEDLVAAFEAAGMLIERLVEVPDSTDPPGDRWQRIPLFLHLRAVRARRRARRRRRPGDARRAAAVRAAARRHCHRGRARRHLHPDRDDARDQRRAHDPRQPLPAPIGRRTRALCPGGN